MASMEGLGHHKMAGVALMGIFLANSLMYKIAGIAYTRIPE
jgi:hypothetical protein